MTISITSGDVFTFDISTVTLTSLFGQTVSYVTGEDNSQDVSNGLGTTNISPTFLEDLLASLGIEDETVIDTVTTTYTEEAGNLIGEILSDDDVFEEILGGLDGVLPGTDLSERISDQIDGIMDIDLELPPIFDWINQLYETVGSDIDLSLIINTGDTFTFDVGDTEIVKMFGQTVSYVSGDGNDQSVVNGFDVESGVNQAVDAVLNQAVASAGTPVAEANTSPAAGNAPSSPALAGSGLAPGGFQQDSSNFFEALFNSHHDRHDHISGDDQAPSIVIDSGDSFDFNVGDTSIVKMFGQTVSYVTGSNNQQTVTNGFRVDGNDESSQGLTAARETDALPPGQDGSSWHAATNSSYGGGECSGGGLFADNQPTIFIDSGDTFDFDVGSVEVVKMFGQTVSYVSGQNNDQTVGNGFDIESDVSQDTAESNTPIAETGTSLADPAQTANPVTSETSATETSEITDILQLVTDLLAAQDNSSSMSIIINTGDTFNFDVDDVSIVKMFGQTVSYVTGEGNVQDVTNGASGEIFADGSLETSPDFVSQILLHEDWII